MTRHRSRPRRCRRAAALLLLTLAQCSEFAPFEGPQPAAAQHSLCYNRANATPEQLRALASQACGGTEPRLLEQVMDFGACPILVPMRVSFACGT
jgi:hypothetical protein